MNFEGTQFQWTCITMAVAKTKQAGGEMVAAQMPLALQACQLSRALGNGGRALDTGSGLPP